MRKTLSLLLIVWAAVVFGCGKSGGDRSGEDGDRADAAQAADKKAGGKSDRSGRPGEKPGDKTGSGEEEIDVDKLDIPDRMKEAIKSGQIPKDQVQAMLAKLKGEAGVDEALVNVENVGRKDLNSYLVLNGVVEPERKIEIYSRLSAYVKQIVKEEGDFVKENDILALLDDTEIRISYQQAKIQLDQAQLGLEEQQNNFQRYQELAKRDMVSEQEFQAAESLLGQRKLEYNDRAESLKNLAIQLNWTKLRSLSEGYITERLIEVGDRITANQQAYTIEDFSPLLIRVFVPTSDSIMLKPGMTSEITSEVLPGSVFPGNVKLVNPRIDVQTGTVKVTIEVTDPSLRLTPGMFVEARIVIGIKQNVLVIPRKALQFKQNKTYVFVVKQGKVEQREIALGLMEEDQAEVTEGLSEGDVIVVVGVESLKDGQNVRVI